MKKAAVITKQGEMTPNGRERILQLRRGVKGRGQLIQSVRCWPWSHKSMESAHDIIFQAAKRAGVDYGQHEA